MIRRARMSMTHRATVQRDANYGGGTDPYGNDAPASWQTHLSGLVCRFWFESGETVIDGDKAVELTVRKMIVPATTDITEDDRVLVVTDRLGTVLFDGPMRIDSVGRRFGHKVLTLVEDR